MIISEQICGANRCFNTYESTLDKILSIRTSPGPDKDFLS
jgi:hypothetical protein